VPSGNFGNLTAGVYAWHWGLPVGSFIAATNTNDVVPEYLATGVFRPRPSRMTLSNAMDVGNPSNFERLRLLFRSDRGAMSSVIRGDSVSDQDTRKAMREVFERFGVYVDPHTAVGYAAARRYLAEHARRNPGTQVVVLATAHPGKFLEIVRDTVGSAPGLPETLARSLSLPKRSVKIGKDLGGLASFLLDTFG
jgi:threonine synthase